MEEKNKKSIHNRNFGRIRHIRIGNYHLDSTGRTMTRTVATFNSILLTLMQPEMSYERGYCRPECAKCAEVCPTDAIHQKGGVPD